MRDPSNSTTMLSGVNAEFLEHLYRQFQEQPDSVTPEWRRFFEAVDNGFGLRAPGEAGSGLPATDRMTGGPSQSAEKTASGHDDLSRQASVNRLINTYRIFGHTRANLDPLGREHMPDAPDFSLAAFGLNEADLDKTFSTDTLVARPMETLRNIVEQVEHTYRRSIGAEYMPIRNQAQRRWLQEAMEGSWNDPKFDAGAKRRILTELAHAELFEKFLHTKFAGQKRFSMEGAESLIVMLNGLVEAAADHGAEELVIGMPHRGRLNTLANVMDKNPAYIFAEFLDTDRIDEATGSGDVKYHKGYSSDRKTHGGKSIHLSLTFNPSHLEVVNPVVEGNVRAKQDRRGSCGR